MLRRAGLASFAACIACAGGPKGLCEPVSPDVVAFVGRPVYRSCEVSKAATAPRSLNAAASSSGYAHCGKATIEVVVDSAGTPLLPSARVVRMSDTAFVREVLVVIGNARFTPANIKGQPVAQLVTVNQSTDGDGRAKVPFAVRRIDGPWPPPSEPVMPKAAGC